jgi:nucleolar protein 53
LQRKRKKEKMPVLRSATAGSGEAPKQYTQPSRKGKKAWRKNVDVTEVEEGLRELNDEIIRGYDVLPPSSLF